MKPATSYFHIKTKLSPDFQICISVPLNNIGALLSCTQKPHHRPRNSLSPADAVTNITMVNKKLHLHNVAINNNESLDKNGK